VLLCYSGRSAPSAQLIADCSDDILTIRNGDGDINWGRHRANTRLNPDISNVTNKRVMRELFAEHGVPTPRLLNVKGDWGYDIPNEVEYPMVGRPDYHSRGRGFWLISNERELVRALRGTRKKRAATHFMQFVEAPREYRCHVFMGKSIRISEKEFFTDEHGKRDYRTVRPTGNVRYVRKAAKQAVKAVGLDFGAVDILARGDDNDEVFVLEVNAAPGLGGTMPQLYAETFLQWIRGDW
jgi:glutathione synthase/RimK-type ligase-like ATP-grasp enzyme